MVLRMGTGAKWSGGYFFPLGMTLQLLKKIQKPNFFVNKNRFFNFWQKSSKNHRI